MNRYTGGANAVDPLNGKQAKCVLNYLKGVGNSRNTLLWALGITTGLRISDLLPLRVQDLLDAERETKKFIKVRETKTGKTRLVPVMKVAEEAFRSHRQQEKSEPNDYLFNSRKGNTPITREQARRLVKRWCEECNLRGNYGTHTLRKTFASIAYANSGGDPVATARVTGHSNPAQLLRYIGEVSRTESQIYEAMNRSFGA